MSFEVAEPILNSPYEEPAEHWVIHEGREPERRQGRRLPVYYYRDPKAKPTEDGDDVGRVEELKLVSLIRERLAAWRKADYPGATRTTRDLLRWWRRDGQKQRLFFAQLEAAETVIFLNEARQDFRQGIDVSSDEPSDDKKAEGYRAFRRMACKMGTGTGKTNVMAMLAAWTILNKVNDRMNARFSDVVLVVCPNVTIRSRLEELKPELGEGSLYAKRELVPPDLMPLLSRGRVLVNNWHVFELQSPSTSGSRVMKAGVIEKRVETITIGEKTTTARGSRYMTREVFEALVASGELRVVGDPETDADGNVSKVRVESTRYVESDKAFVNRVLGREVGGKQNIMVFNDEAHHAYRIRRAEDDDETELFAEEEEADEFFKEATVWIDGLDRIHKQRGINLCVDLSATPYFLGRVGQDTNRPFPWVVSDFGLVEAIESGLVKIPQFAIRDTSGAEFAQYFNVWEWVMGQLSKGERGGKRTNPKPEAILKYAANPITLLAGDWQEDLCKWDKERKSKDPRPPVFIVVCKTTQLAKVVYEWLAEDKAPAGVAPCKIEGFRPAVDGTKRAIRVDTKVVNETDAGQAGGAAKSEESRWMRFTLDTVGKTAWPTDRQGRPIHPEGFEELATKLGRPLHPPGRDVRCIVSVAMLTEGWDCCTVTHVVGLRPFMSQLLCEQVVGRALRRISYDAGPDGKLGEEIAQVFGVPFHMVPFKAQKQAAPSETPSKTHIHALPGRAQFRIVFPRVEGYVQFIRDRVTVNWDATAPLVLDPGSIPPEAQMKAGMYSEKGHLTLNGPGDLETLSMNPFRRGRRMQELKFDIARALTLRLGTPATCRLPVHVLFPQILGIVSRYLDEKIHARAPAEKVDVFVSPYFDWVIERLSEAIHSQGESGETIERPVYEKTRGPGSTDEISFWTMRDVREVKKSHVAFVVADTQKWEQQAGYYLDTDKRVEAFVKNAGLGFAIPYFHSGHPHEYVPDFIVRLVGQPPVHVILETKGYDPLADIKTQAARRWADAVNADGRYGTWRYQIVRDVSDIPGCLGSR